MTVQCPKMATFMEKLHLDLIESIRRCRHYKQLYNVECAANKKLVNKVKHLIKKIAVCKIELQVMKSKIPQTNNSDEVSSVMARRKQKSWCKLKCERTKRQ